MECTQTDIIDKNLLTDSDAIKILLMDDLIEHFSPLFYEDLRKKQRLIKSSKIDINRLKNVLIEKRKIILKLKSDIEIEKVKNQILLNIEKLNNIDVLYGKNKITVQSILNSIDKQSIQTLKKRLALLQNLVDKKSKRG